MSRFTANLPDGRQIAWGYDRPLSEYFVQVYKAPHEMKDENDEILFSISNYITLQPHPDTPDKTDYSNAEILAIMNKYPQIPHNHRAAVAADLPF